MYSYETHTHTREASACASCTGAESARAHKNAGYTGIVITNHFYYGNTSVDRGLPWHDWVRRFCDGYRSAKEEGDRIGLQVFFGWESGYKGTEFLIYGLDESWLYAHPEIRDASVEEQYRLVHADGGMVIHAHPFRDEPYIPEIRLYPEHVDAVEVINATHCSPLSTSHFNPEFDEKAQVYADQNGLPVTAGSDTHHTAPLFGGGMGFDRPMNDIHDLIMAIRKGSYKALMPVT